MKKVINLFEGNTLSIIDWEGQLEMAHKFDGKISYEIMNDPIRFNEEDLVEKVNIITAEILKDYIKENITDEVAVIEGETVRIETFSYEIWIDVNLNEKTNKIEYFVSTARLEAVQKGEVDYSEMEKNKNIRKTFKGLLNYIKRFQ